LFWLYSSFFDIWLNYFSVQEIICVTVVTTTKFTLDNDGWYYLVCNHCNKRTNEIGPFKCTYCDQENNISMFKFVFYFIFIQLHMIMFLYFICYNIPNVCRYKLQLQVCDDAFNCANFVVWDQECRNIIGISAEELQKKMIKVNTVSISLISCFVIDIKLFLFSFFN